VQVCDDFEKWLDEKARRESRISVGGFKRKLRKLYLAGDKDVIEEFKEWKKAIKQQERVEQVGARLNTQIFLFLLKTLKSCNII